MKNNTIVIAGGSGFIGQAFWEYFAPHNKVYILGRGIRERNNAYASNASTKSIETIQWDGKNLGDWVAVLEDADLLINLCGKSVNCRYTAKNKQAIFDSRTTPTALLGQAIATLKHPPKLWINASSATIYRHAEDRPQDEYAGEIHNDFSVQVCKLWEKTFFDQVTPRTRKVALRTAIVLGTGGVLTPYRNLVRFGLGGRQGHGKQMFSWVHVDDVCRMIEWCWINENLSGVFNCSSPKPVSNATFMKTLRQAMHTNYGLPAPAWLLKLGGRLIGTEAELILKSRWVLPTKILKSGFQFLHPDLDETLHSLLQHESS